MNFINDTISTQNLPTIEHISFHPLEKEYLKVSRITFYISCLIVLIAVAVAFYFIKKIQSPVVISSAAAIFIFLTISGWISMNLGFKSSGYALRDKDILYKRGWFIRKTRIVPITRIQHVSLQSGPIERKFGLASISIYTAGSQEADFTIRGISGQTAQQIKEWISTKLNEELN
jgi:hypothetical protein